MRRQVQEWRQAQITDERTKLILYAAFVDGKLEVPRSLLPEVHRLYFQPEYEEFSPRTMWSLSNAFTSAFKELDPVPQFKATAKLGRELQLPDPQFELSSESGRGWNGTPPIGVSAFASRSLECTRYRHGPRSYSALR